MLFNSLLFLVFFPLTVLGYFALPHRFRWMWLLAASCYFYASFIPAYLLILLLLIGMDYLLARGIEEATGKRKKALLLFSIGGNLGTLFLFKYFNFFNENAEALAHVLNWNYSLPALRILLPLGLSFFIFQSMSYVIDVYRGSQKAERHLGIYALYVMFFPQLVAGPIERSQNMLRQFHERHTFQSQDVLEGLTIMLRGFFKKVVIADRLALLVDHVYGNIPQSNGLTLTIATIAFAIQIYADFSGYSDIAIGAARILGFRLMKNFDQPYFANSISDFWRRWHISLSSWLRDYVYIPLGGNRVAPSRKHLNILAVFLLSGLWHGANWTFVVWGAWHGVLLILFETMQDMFRKIPRPIQIAITSCLVTFGWIFFRARNMDEAMSIIQGLTQGWSFHPEQLGISLISLMMVVVSIIMIKLVRKPVLRTSVYYCLILWILFFGYTEAKTFIYFQF